MQIQVFRVRAAPGVDVVDWRVPARHLGARIVIGRDINGEPIVTEITAAETDPSLAKLRKMLRDRDLLPADEATARLANVPFEVVPVEENTADLSYEIELDD